MKLFIIKIPKIKITRKNRKIGINILIYFIHKNIVFLKNKNKIRSKNYIIYYFIILKIILLYFFI